MSIHINGDNNDVNVVYGDVYNGDVYNGDEQLPRLPVGLFGLFMTVAILIAIAVKYWQVTLAVVSLGALAFGYWLERQEKVQAKTEAKVRKAALSRRAEVENEAYLRGDPRGVYGNFPPPPEMML